MEERKVNNIKNPAAFWRPPETYCPNMAISEFLSSKSGNFGNHCLNMAISEFFSSKSGDFGTFFLQT
jgi:hypothetical protein